MKADVLTFVRLLAATEVDEAALERRYRDATLALDATGEWATRVDLLEHGLDAVTFEANEGALRVLAVAYDDAHLWPERARSLDAVVPGWRDRRGTPQAFVPEDENDRAFRLYPRPDEASGDMSFPRGEPFGRDWPVGAIAIFATEQRDDLPSYLDLPLALLALAREFAADTDHRDAAFASAAEALVMMMLEMVG